MIYPRLLRNVPTDVHSCLTSREGNGVGLHKSGQTEGEGAAGARAVQVKPNGGVLTASCSSTVAYNELRDDDAIAVGCTVTK